MKFSDQDHSSDLIAIAHFGNPVVALSRSLLMRRHHQMRRREQGMMMRLGSEIGLAKGNASRYEGHIQGKMPHNFSSYGRSAATMS